MVSSKMLGQSRTQAIQKFPKAQSALGVYSNKTDLQGEAV